MTVIGFDVAFETSKKRTVLGERRCWRETKTMTDGGDEFRITKDIDVFVRRLRERERECCTFATAGGGLKGVRWKASVLFVVSVAGNKLIVLVLGLGVGVIDVDVDGDGDGT